MRGEEVILLNFPISHFLKSLAHSAVRDQTAQITLDLPQKNLDAPAAEPTLSFFS